MYLFSYLYLHFSHAIGDRVVGFCGSAGKKKEKKTMTTASLIEHSV